MDVTLFDTKKNQDVHLEVTVEYTTPCPHLLLVLANPSQTQTYEDGRESKSFGEYEFIVLHHLAGVKFKYEGRTCSLTLGFYLDNQRFLPVLLDQTGMKEADRFANAQQTNFQEYEVQSLINAQEYDCFAKLGISQLSFGQYATRVIEQDYLGRSFSRVFYDITVDQKEFKCENLVDEERFEMFLEEDEFAEEDEELLEED